MEYELQLRAMLYNKKKYYDSESGRKEFAEYTEPQSEFNACDGSDTGKGLGYNGGTSEYEYRTLSEDNGIVHQTSDSKKNGRNDERLVGTSVSDEHQSYRQYGESYEKSTDGNEKYSVGDEEIRRTGWEETRREYERFRGQIKTSNVPTGRQSGRTGNKKVSHSVGRRNNSVLNNIGSVSSALSALGSIGGKRKDDEDEEPDVTMGVIAGVAIGTALAIHEYKKEKEREIANGIENKIDKSTSAYSNQYEDENEQENENEELTGPVMSGM